MNLNPVDPLSTRPEPRSGMYLTPRFFEAPTLYADRVPITGQTNMQALRSLESRASTMLHEVCPPGFRGAC
jgi:hypothetical protein